MGAIDNISGAAVLTTLPEPQSSETSKELTKDALGQKSVREVAYWLSRNGVKAQVIRDRKSPFDLVCNGLRVEVKTCQRRIEGNWQFNIHRHGEVKEDQVDAYVLRLENVPDIVKPLHLILLAPLRVPTFVVTLRSLILNYSRYINRLDVLGGKALEPDGDRA